MATRSNEPRDSPDANQPERPGTVPTILAIPTIHAYDKPNGHVTRGRTRRFNKHPNNSRYYIRNRGRLANIGYFCHRCSTFVNRDKNSFVLDSNSCYFCTECNIFLNSSDRSSADSDGADSQYVINLSSKPLSRIEYKVLSKGLKFIPTPNHRKIVGLEDSFKSYQRLIRLHYYFSTRPVNHRDEHPFRPKSSWEPPPANRTIENYLSHTKLELSNLRSVSCKQNLTDPERRALRKLSTDESLTIKQADKGSLIVVEDTNVYIENGRKHLNDRKVYETLPSDPTEGLATHIHSVLDGLKTRGFIDSYEHQFMLPCQTPRSQVMYFLKKLHKNPYSERPIVSGCEGATEKISAYLDHVLKPLMSFIPSYLKNSYTLIQELNTAKFPSNCILCTIDVVQLYPSIPQSEGTQACLSMLDKFKLLPFPKEYLSVLFDLVLSGNIFNFAGKTYRQIRGTAMGTRMAPNYANVFMGKLEEDFLRNRNTTPAILKRYIDDIFIVWTNTRSSLLSFLNDLNQFHPNIKFTYCIDDKSVTYLDLDIYKGDQFHHTGKFDYKTHFKSTNKFQYLHFDSAHPNHAKKGLVKGELTRISRTTSSRKWKEANTKTVSQAFKRRCYPHNLTRPPTKHSRLSQSNTIQFTTMFNPRCSNPLPALTKHWLSIYSDSSSSGFINYRPSICYKTHKNLSRFLVKAKTPGSVTKSTELSFTPPVLPKRTRVTRCAMRRCPLCPHLRDIHQVSGVHLKDKLSCSSNNVVYLISCRKCPSKIYIGQTSRKLKLRFAEHINRCNKKTVNWPIYNHFNRPDHKFPADAQLSPIQKCKPGELLYIESQWINKLSSRHPRGLNSMFTPSTLAPENS